MPTPEKKWDLGVSAGVYFPTDGRLKSAVGSSVSKLGIDFGPHPHLHDGALSPSLSLISAHGRGNDFYLGQAMLSYEKLLAKPTTGYWAFLPFVRIGAGLAYADYSITDVAGNHTAAKRILPTGQLLLGALIGDRLRINASYNIFESASSYNFNGFNLTVSYALFRF